MRRLFRSRRAIFWLCIIVVYGVVMIFGGCADKLILFPSRQPIHARTAHRETVALDQGRSVEVWVDRSPGATGGDAEPQAYLIEFTGNATRAEQVASYAASRWGDRAVEVWMVNYPGYGGSTGPAQLKAIPPAALAVYDHVAKNAGGKPIFLAGNSLGTTAALYVATQRPTAGLILQNPPAIRNLILSRYGWWNLWLIAGPIALQVPKELDGPTNAAKAGVPAMFVLAEKDDFVVPVNQKRVVEAYAGPKRVILLTGGHNDGITGNAEQELQKGIEWMWQSAVRTK
jgi:pimeloyl-ACP methyl ester carboxylesterase